MLLTWVSLYQKKKKHFVFVWQNEEIIQRAIFFLLISYPVGWPVVLKHTHNFVTELKPDIWTFKTFVYLRQIYLLSTIYYYLFLCLAFIFLDYFSKIDSFLIL